MKLELLEDFSVIEMGLFRTHKVLLRAESANDISVWAETVGVGTFQSTQDAIRFFDSVRAHLLKSDSKEISTSGSLDQASSLLWFTMNLFAKKSGKKKKKPEKKKWKPRVKHVYRFSLLEPNPIKLKLVRRQGIQIYSLLDEFCKRKGSRVFTHDDAVNVILDNMHLLDTVQNPADLWRYFRKHLRHARLVKWLTIRSGRTSRGKILERRGEEASEKAKIIASGEIPIVES